MGNLVDKRLLTFELNSVFKINKRLPVASSCACLSLRKSWSILQCYWIIRLISRFYLANLEQVTSGSKASTVY